MTKQIHSLLLMLLMLAVSSAAYALDDNERAILKRAGISADDGALRFNDDGHIYAVDLSARGLKTIPFALLELPYVEDINLNSNPFNGDIGALASAYLQSNPTIGKALCELWIEDCGLTGNIGPLAGALSQINYLNAGGNSITDISPIPEDMKCVVRLDMQQYDLTVDFTPGVTTPESLRSQLPRAALYDPWNFCFKEDFGIECYPGGEYNFNIYVWEGFGYWIDDHIRLVNGDTFNAEAVNGKFRLTLHFQEGDVNLSGAIDEADVQETVDYILANNTAYAYNATAGDVNHDGTVNVLDLVTLQHRVAGTTPTATTIGQNTLAIRDLKMPHNEALLPYELTNSNDIAAMQFDLTLPEGLSYWSSNIERTERTESDDYAVCTTYFGTDNEMDTYRILIFSPTGRNIPAGDGPVAQMRLEKDEDWTLDFGRLKIDNAVLASPDSRNVLTQTSAGVIDFTSLPQLTAEVSKNVVTEGETIQLTVSLPEATAQPLEVTLQSEDATRFEFKQKQTIPAGQMKTVFTVTAIDDDLPLLDLSNLFTVSAPDYDNAEVLVFLKDNDMPMLQLTITPTEINELDGDGAATVTLRRTSNIDKKVTVELSDDSDGRLAYQHYYLEMEAGVEEISFHLGASDNDITDGDQTYHLTAAIYVASCSCAASSSQSAGYVQATIRVLDDDGPNGHKPTRKLADAIVNQLTIDKSDVEVGGDVSFNVTVKNQGTDVLPQTLIKLYSTLSGHVATLRTNGELAVGASETIERKLIVTHVGNDRFYAVVNEDEEVPELRYGNNYSQELAVKVKSPYTATISTEKQTYMQTEKVKIIGQLEGRKISNTSIDVYFINNGDRQVETVLTNAQGAFSYEFTPMEYQTGHFIVGACYPGEDASTEMAAFNVYGLRRADYSYISSEIIVGETHKGNIVLQNPGVLDLSVVQATILSKPDNIDVNLTMPPYIVADGEVALKYELTANSPSPKKQWEEVKVLISSAEGANLPVTLYYYAQMAGAQLKAIDGNLPLTEVYATMQKDTPRDYPLMVTNVGRGHTGKITLSLPKCITSPMGQTLSCLEAGDTAIIMLRFVPTDDMQLNVPVTGMFSVDVENGEGFSMNFSVTPQSSEWGTMLIDVTDELTYYTSEAPHVEGAEVVVRNPVTEALVTQGKTDAKGHFSVNLPEGYYQVSVSADKHNSVQNYVVVNPGVTTEKEFCLTYQAVTITWTAEETEVEDEYRIVTTYDFETNVPVPVVQMNTIPERIAFDHLAQGESLIYHTVLTNKGLITANGTTLQLPQNDEFFTWEPLAQYENIALEPQQSIIIPVRVTRVANSTAAPTRGTRRAASGGMPCTLYQAFTFYWMCGLEEHFGYGGLTLYFKACPISGEGGGGGGFVPHGNSSGGGGSSSSGGSINLVGFDCRKFVEKLWDIADCLSSFLPVSIGDVEDGVKCALERYRAAKDLIQGGVIPNMMPWGDMQHCFKLGMGKVPGVDKVLAINTCYKAFGSGFGSLSGAPDRVGTRRAEVEPSYATYFREITALRAQELEAVVAIGLEVFGDSVWLHNATGEELEALMNAVSADDGRTYTITELKPYQPGTISDAQFAKFVERINNTLTHDRTGQVSENMISIERLLAHAEVINDVEFEATRRNYESGDEMFRKEYEIFMNHLQEHGGSSVCATIKLQIAQTMTLTRQAVRGTLTIENGSESIRMTDIKLQLKVMSSQGVMATAKEFEMHVESLEGFKGDLEFDSGWTLEAGEKGTSVILFTPTKFAAPVRPIDYSFGGTLSYTDSNGARVTRELFPVTLTVKPTPELDLVYFMQRDIWGDDPLTEDVVEPMVPAEFAVLINNKGYGDANNVRMVTEQPKIIENEKGLYIDFEILSSLLNGQEKMLAMGQNVATEFGIIPAHSQSWAQWNLQSTLMGHFVSYNIEATHVNSYGNPDLSLLDQVTIHELIHGFTKPAATDQHGWLVNDEQDSDDTPDRIYFSDATTFEVKQAAIATIEEQEDNTCYLLNVIPGKEGWTYGSLEDPTEGHQRLVSVVRQRDKMVMPADNFWTTDRTMRDGREPVYENRLHFIADMLVDGETYLLTFEPRPDVILEVEEFPDQPDPELVMTEQVKELKVRFNKPIDEQTFTTDDITLTCQGKHLKTDAITIIKKDDVVYRLDISALTLGDGYYVLTVQTSGITDTEGFRGEVGKQAAWIQYTGTGIQEFVNEEERSKNIYNLNGQRLSVPSGSSVNSVLPRGLYIVNGKKVLVK